MSLALRLINLGRDVHYTVTVVGITVISLGAIVGLIFLRKTGGSEQDMVIFGAITVFLAPTIASLVSILKTMENRESIVETKEKIEQLGQQINGNAKESIKRAHAQGYNEGAARARQPKD